MSAEIGAEVLERTLTEILEQTAFCFSERTEDPPEWQGPVFVAELEFSGPGGGRLLLALPSDFATELATNLLGLEPGDPDGEKKAADAVGEVLNIVSGAMMPEVFGAAALVEFSSPRVESLDAAAWSKRAGPDSVRISLLVDELTRVDFAFLKPGEPDP
ncbi:MAG: chemotaxis protein CheX [Myxococcota bacterium]